MSGYGGDFATQAAVMCKACSMPSDVTDRDTRASKYYIVFYFGDLVDTSGALVSNVHHYEVYWTAANGRQLDLPAVATIPATSSSACCAPKKYKVAIMGNFSADYADTYRLAVTAVSTSMVTTSSGSRLPLFSFTPPIMDISMGQAQRIAGHFEVTMSDADAIAINNDPDAKEAFGKAFATTLGLTPEEVLIKAITVTTSGGRRLSAEERRLASTVKVDYEIITTMDKVVDIANVDKAALTTNIQAEAQAIGVPVTVTGVSVPAPTVSEVVGTPPGTTGSSSSVVFHLMAFVIAAGIHNFC